jgi:membrane-bound metal-dependent hydrolase YbcI (DUF457 family)
MANFPTHIAVGTVVSGALATVTVAAEMIQPEDIVAVTLAGVLGSVLPDIDLKDSRPSRAMFAGLAVFFSFAVLFSLERRYSIAEMLILWLGTMVLVRYAAQSVFHRFSAHRGIWHSIAAGLFCAFLTALIYRKILQRDEAVSWLAGGFMMIGYLTHLVLDEIYSVDVADRRIKASFGTALKIIDQRHPAASTAMVVAAAMAFWIAPPIKPFVDVVSQRTLWTGLQHRLLPQERWFGAMAVLDELPFRARSDTLPATAPANPLATGSIPATEPAPPAQPPQAADTLRNK